LNEQVAAWLEKADDSLRAARTLNDARFHSEAISRAYYVMFYAAKALLVAEGQDLSKHSAVIAAFGHDFVAGGKLPSELHRYLRNAFDARNLSDYRTTPNSTKESAAEHLAHAEEFLAAIEAFLGETPE
jgi:uncharacterized protein (UPF0332 family)